MKDKLPAKNKEKVDNKDQLERIKKNIEKAEMGFKDNNKRYHDYQRMVFQSAIEQNDEDTLRASGKPIIEFNITNAPLSRMCGEFSKQEPSIEVRAKAGAKVEPELIEFIEGHMRHIFDESKKHNTQYITYRDQLSGGFSMFKVYTEYEHPMSFEQMIGFKRVYEPTMCGFDPMAREVDKRDAAWCYELFPMEKEEFKEKYPDVDLQEVSFTRMDNNFNWSYSQGKQDIILLSHYYEHKRKRTKIVKLADNRVLTKKEYDEFMKSWGEQGFIEQPPAIVSERETELDSIKRYEIMETEVLETIDTSFLDNPLVFVDGDSVIIKKNDDGNMQQFTKPYVYHAKGMQRLLNFSGQVIANDFEMMVMHKFKVAKESIPQEKEYQDAYANVQEAATLVYNAFMDNDPDKPIPPPMEIARVGLPPEVPMVFNTSMQMLQNILGTYDSQLGINDNQLSGVAIVEAATQSNATGMPYIVNYMQSLTQVANIILKLIPKYYVTPRSVPVINKDGTRSEKLINQPGGIAIKYDENTLSVVVEAGPNFAIQKSKALQQVTLMMQANERFAAFMNTQGLPFLLDNMEFKGSDVLREKAMAWMEKEEEAEAKKQQEPNPELIKMQMAQQQMQLQAQLAEQELQFKREEAELKHQIDMAKLAVEEAKVETERLDIMQKAGESREKLMMAITKAHAEEERALAELHIKVVDTEHQHGRDVATHAKDMIQLHHEMKMAEKESNKPKEAAKPKKKGKK